MKRLALLLCVIAGCTHEAASKEAAPTPAPAPTAQPGSAPIQPAVTPPPTVTAPPVPKPATHVELTAVTLADDCGGAPPSSAPVRVQTAKRADSARSDDEARSKMKREPASRARGAKRCEQTSMQLAISAGSDATIQVKSVELFDEAGKSLGTLAASKPTRWSDSSGRYDRWDETVAAGSTSSVSYVLAQPKWHLIGDRWNQTYTLKVVVSVSGVDQSAQKTLTLMAPTSLPPNVRT